MEIRISKDPYYDLVKLCVLMLFATASFDIIGTIEISGFTFRLCQIFSIILILCWFLEIQKQRIRLPIGSNFLLCWIITQFIFIFRSANLANAMGYFAWLMLDISVIFCLVQYIGRVFSLQWLLRTYLNSFIWIAWLGIAQFVLFAFGIDLFVRQHWTDTLARINGFSYEPSYYSTYLLPGFVIYAYLFEKRNEELFPYKKIRKRLIIISTALILSTSRMGWLMMVVWLALRTGVYLVKFVRGGISKRMLWMLILEICLIIVAVYLFFAMAVSSRYNYLLNGLGLYGMAGHSSSGRLIGLYNCINIFKESPIFGYSLGGVDPQIAEFVGITYRVGVNGSFTNAVGEILVANGIVGLIPFIGYMYHLATGRKKSRREQKPVIYKALVLAFVFEMGIIFMNQNILRVYLWCLIAVLSAAEYQFRQNELIRGSK